MVNLWIPALAVTVSALVGAGLWFGLPAIPVMTPSRARKAQEAVRTLPGIVAPGTYGGRAYAFLPCRRSPQDMLPDARLGAAPSNTTYVRVSCKTWECTGPLPQAGTLNMTKLCSGFSPADVVPTEDWPPAWPGNGTADPQQQNFAMLHVVGTLGLASNVSEDSVTFASPFLRACTAEGKTSWSFSALDTVCALYAGTPTPPCVTWVWAPMSNRTTSYALDLVPLVTAPWSLALVDVGTWDSNLPGGDPTGATAYLLTLSSPGEELTTITIPPSSYTVQADVDSDTCTLGASALANRAAVSVDFVHWKLGITSTLVGLGTNVTDLVVDAPPR